ncbi:MAG: chloride channel protein [Myxococcales bacterium]|nr:chloride channel protein [Myxococcales bacterium]
MDSLRPGPARRLLEAAAQRMPLALDARLLGLVALAGALAGLLATGYWFALELALHGVARLDAQVPVYVLMPAAGLLVGLCYHLLGKPGETDAVVDNIHVANGRIDTRANVPLLPISLLSIAAGGSAGPEAPMVYLTGSVGSWLQRWLPLREAELRTLTFTGMAVGFATLFGAPIGAAIFALEIPHRRGLEYYEATVPVIIGCLVGHTLFAALTGAGLGPVWRFAPYVFTRWQDLAIAAGLGIAIGLATMPFVVGLKRLRRLFDRVRVPMAVKATLGGAILGLVAWWLPPTRSWGELQLQGGVIDASLGARALLLLGVAKMLTVAVTLASGWRGGIIIPCFFIGACLGQAAALVVPGVDPTLAMLVGMAAVNVAVMKVPLATVLVVTAMSGVAAMPAIAAASFASFVVSGGVNFLEAKRERGR